MDEQRGMASIYVYPTEEGKPPRAKVIQMELGDEVPDTDMVEATAYSMEVVWSHDAGTWVNGPHSLPMPQDIADAITAHAKDLGVEW